MPDECESLSPADFAKRSARTIPRYDIPGRAAVLVKLFGLTNSEGCYRAIPPS
ncbi:protein of unknown function [Bradyrhizobium vignae]|uniref:Uncharacterized protein n=1 Tax=Bradyrhizobium vignae TaxID=1549949 RepID=A0A2U3PYE4_9BRAD|nr:protein of unknown function [Bradyrhizobium vignae]